MASMKSASRYDTFDTTTRSSSEKLKPKSGFNRLIGASSTTTAAAIVKAKRLDILPNNKKNDANSSNLGSMVKKFITSKPKKPISNLLIPADLIAKDIKKDSYSGFAKKFFSTKSSSNEKKALTEVKSNTRTLAMVLRSERELLALQKEQDAKIAQLNSMLDRKSNEVEKLKDLCLKQREEIRSLKSAVLFPDMVNLEIEDMLEKQGSELNQAKQLIPNLQRQVTSLTGQIQSLAVDLAEVKADKYSSRSRYDSYVGSPKTLTYDQQDATNSLDFSSEDQTTPGSPDDMFLKDLNPCLTPYSKTKSKESDDVIYESPRIKAFSRNKLQLGQDNCFDPYLGKISKSSDCCQCSNSGSSFARTGCKSDETKSAWNQMR